VTSPATPGTSTGADAPQPEFDCVEGWIDGYFLPVFRRKLGGQYRWCARWWAHAEAVSRLTALWRAWEAMRLEPATGISDWYGAHLDHHLIILLGPDGPFCQCDPKAGVHLELPAFRVEPVDYDALDGGDGGEDPGPDTDEDGLP
jgi:hypothetical protein